MPNWLTQVLKWGGIALAIVFAIAGYIVPSPTAEAGSTAPVTFYWVMAAIGVVAAIIGFAVERRSSGGGT